MQETWIWSLGQEDPLEEEMTTLSSILAWRIPWPEEPGGLHFIESQRVGHVWACMCAHIQRTHCGEAREEIFIYRMECMCVLLHVQMHTFPPFSFWNAVDIAGISNQNQHSKGLVSEKLCPETEKKKAVWKFFVGPFPVSCVTLNKSLSLSEQWKTWTRAEKAPNFDFPWFSNIGELMGKKIPGVPRQGDVP